MIARPLLLAVVVSWCGAASAQSPETATLVHRYAPGDAFWFETRTEGETRGVGGTDSTVLSIDAASVVLARVDAVAADGAAKLTLRPSSSVVRLGNGGRTFTVSSGSDGVVVAVDGTPWIASDDTAGESTLRLSPAGRVLEATAAADPTALNGAVGGMIAFPSGPVAVGATWSSEAHLPGMPEAGLPSLQARIVNQLYAVDVREGRRIATILSNARASAPGAIETASVTTRFDIDAGRVLGSDATIDLDVTVSGPEAGAPTHLTGRLRTATSSRRLRGVDARAPDPNTLGPARDGWSLSGGTVLRFYGSPSAAACRADCDGTAECRGYTWVKPGGYTAGDPPVCYLMRTLGSANRHGCCVAATRGIFPAPDR